VSPPQVTDGVKATIADGAQTADIRITDVTAEGTSIHAEVERSRRLRRFFDDERFFVEYDTDVSALPESILTIPVLAHVSPLAWATGADVHVPTVDERYLRSLRAVGTVLAEMYPALMEGGRVIAEDVPAWSSLAWRSDESAPPGSDAESDVATLFTGGVDSLTTYIRHREEEPSLVYIQGWVVGIDEDERWERTKRVIEEYGRRFGVQARFVRSNMLSFLDWPMLIAHFSRYHDGGWYSAVAGGLGLTGLVAPLTVVNGYRRLYVPATVWRGMSAPAIVDHWDGIGMPWGSHPDIEGNIGWAETEPVHDGGELSRQERIGVIAEYVRQSDRSDLLVRSCGDSERAANCNQCEKCFRTGFGLALEGIDPANHGFELGPEDFDRTRAKLESGDWIHNEHHANYWTDMRARDPPDGFPVAGGAEFFEWLQTVDLDANARSPTPLGQRTLHTAMRTVPYPVYRNVKSLYESLNG